MTQDGRQVLLVTTKGDASLVALDVATGEIIGVAATGNREIAKPHELTLTKDGGTAIVSLYGSSDYGRNQPWNQLGVIDLSTMRETRRIDLGLYRGPHALITDDEGLIWVTVEESQSLLVIDPHTFEILQTVWLQLPGHFLARSHDGERLYVAHKQYPVISVIDIAARRVVERIDLPRGSQALRVSPDDRLLYAGDFNRPILHVIDCVAAALVQSVPLEGVPGWPCPTPDGRHVVVTTFDEPSGVGFVEILSALTLRPVGVISLDAEPFHAIAAGDGRHAYVALADGRIPKIDLKHAVIAEDRLRTTAAMPEALVLITR